MASDTTEDVDTDSEFERATSVIAVGDGRYEGRVAAGWDIAGNANGGYLMAVAARAMASEVGRPPLSLTAHFVSPGPVGPATITTDVVRDGRRMAVVRGTLSVDDRTVITLLGTFAHPVDPDDSAPTHESSEPPALPPYEDSIPGSPPGDSGFGERVRARYHPDDIGFALGRPTGDATMRGWFRFADDGPIDPYGLLLATDAFAPVCFNVPGVPVAWAPTLELTVHVRAVPAPGPVRARFRSRHLRDGFFEEDGEVWDATGRLVAQSRQLALVPKG